MTPKMEADLRMFHAIAERPTYPSEMTLALALSEEYVNRLRQIELLKRLDETKRRLNQ